MTNFRLLTTAPALAGVVSASMALTGCSAVMTTTDAAATAVGSISEGLEASTQVSITEPEGARYARARAYVASQMPMIRREAAAGGGENIRALATLLGAPDPGAFGEWMQENYARLFSGLKKPEMLVARIKRYRGAAAR